MLLNSESLSLSKRQDINALLSRFVRDGIVSEEFAMNLRENSVKEYPEGSVSKYTEWSTYVPFRDAILLQLNSSKDMKAEVIIGKDAISDQNLTTTFELSPVLASVDTWTIHKNKII